MLPFFGFSIRRFATEPIAKYTNSTSRVFPFVFIGFGVMCFQYFLYSFDHINVINDIVIERLDKIDARTYDTQSKIIDTQSKIIDLNLKISRLDYLKKAGSKDL